MSSAALHVVLGAGQVGTLLPALLRARGHRVRVVRRGPFPAPLLGVETVSADVGDPAAATAALAGAAVVYHCASPAYWAWGDELPRLTSGILAGAARAGARLVVLDNLYMYGATARMTEATPIAPVSVKGHHRAAAAAQLLEAHARGDVRVAIGRASDFFGPDAVNAHLGDRFFRRVFAGKAGECLGDPDQPHTYSFTPDVAAGLVTLGHEPRGDGAVWMLPAPPAESTREVVARMGRALGQVLRVEGIPGWALRLMGLVSRPMRELAEMRYQWQRPFVIDDGRFRATFDQAATPWDDAIARTMAWAVARYAPAAARQAA